MRCGFPEASWTLPKDRQSSFEDLWFDSRLGSRQLLNPYELSCPNRNRVAFRFVAMATSHFPQRAGHRPLPAGVGIPVSSLFSGIGWGRRWRACSSTHGVCLRA